MMYVQRGDVAARERLKMSDQKKDDELDQVSGGRASTPLPIDPIKPIAPPSHPIMPGNPIKDKSNPVG
jgi:hypothetical protein